MNRARTTARTPAGTAGASRVPRELLPKPQRIWNRDRAAVTSSDDAEQSLSDILGIVGTAGAIFSYVLVYAFRLGEAIRYRFDPSLITVSVNDFLTVLIPFALCALYLVASLLLVRDLGRVMSAIPRRAGGLVRTRPDAGGRGASTMLGVLVALGYIAALAAVGALSGALIGARAIPAALASGAVASTAIGFAAVRRVQARLNEGDGASMARDHGGAGALVYTACALSGLPFGLALLINQLQTSAWISLVIAAVAAAAIVCALARLELTASVFIWIVRLMRRGGRGAAANSPRAIFAVGVLAVSMLALFLFAGYSNELDFTGSHTLMLQDEGSGATYAVLALFDGNRAVVRDATPLPQSGIDDGTAYAIDLSKPYRMVYITDGYAVTQASRLETRDP